MMEAEIDLSTEPMVVDSSSDCSSLDKALDVQAVSGTLDSGQFISSSGASVHHSHTKAQQFSCRQGLAAQRSKDDLEVIEVRCLLLKLRRRVSYLILLIYYVAPTQQPAAFQADGSVGFNT